MSKQARKPCPRCRQLQGRVDALQAEVHALRAQLLALQEQLAAAKKDSSTSSKPPSSDIVKRPPAGGDAAGERKIGGQPGHPKHERELFPEGQVTHFENHLLDTCPCCGGVLRRNGNLIQLVQQVDIEKPPLSVEQHSFPEYWCASCQKGYKAPLPAHLDQGGLVGPQLTALIAYLKGACHASFSTIRVFLRDVVQVTISRGQLSKILGKVSAALAKPYEEYALPDEAVLNVDETGHRDNMARRFRAHGAAYFTFLTTPGVEPTNNLAEQAIRFVVIDRHITQGTRSAGGRQWSERIWTVIATCVQQGKSVYDFLCAAIEHWFKNEPAPSLLPKGAGG